MILEIKVFGSAEWYEQVLPEIRTMGFSDIAELGWADPETDGEMRGYYFEYTRNSPIPIAEFSNFMANMEKVIMEGEAPYVKINIVKDKRKAKS